MKNTKLLFLAGAAVLLLAGCTPDPSSSTPGSSSSEPPVVAKHYFGAGGYATYNNSPAAYVGHVQAEVNYAAVLTDEAGKIEMLRIDTVQVNMAVGESGYFIKSNAVGDNGDVKSKWELLEGYNMASASPIEKEWYEQAEAFENYAVGKTLVELKGKVNAEDELVDGVTAGVTITVNHFVSAVEVALANKVLIEGPVAAIAVGGINAKSMQAPAYTTVKGYDFTIAGAAFDSAKKVLAARVDTFQIELATVEEKAQINETKKQVVAAEHRIKGKQELKEAYGMAPASPIEKEWYEQAAALVAHLVGKTVSAALGTEDELSNGVEVGVTMTISGYRDALLEAEKTAFNSRK